jgi:hypothetical protein
MSITGEGYLRATARGFSGSVVSVLSHIRRMCGITLSVAGEDSCLDECCAWIRGNNGSPMDCRCMESPQLRVIRGRCRWLKGYRSRD